MNAKVAAGLIVLTAVGTYVIAHHRRHHFEPTTFQDGAVLLDTETGVLCSARVGTKWTGDDKKAVAEASLAAQEAHQEFGAAYDASPAIQVEETYGTFKTGRVITTHCDDKCVNARDAMETADANYWTVVRKADIGGVPDANTPGIKGFPLCKNIR